MTTNRVRVFFQLTQDEDGYPPAAVESVWAEPCATEGEFVLDNVPFFSREATTGDTVRARREEGHYQFEVVLQRSSNSLVRVVFFEIKEMERVAQFLVNLGCDTEFLSAHKLLAVNIPSTVELGNVQRYLKSECDAGTLDYEEPILRQ